MPAGFPGSVVAIDWSGAKAASTQRATIRAATAHGTDLPEIVGGRTRDQTIDAVCAHPGRLLVGLDFSFGFPEWFAREHGCATIDDVWSLAERDGDTWLGCTPPFWRARCLVPSEHRFRRCEERTRARGFPAKSIFQLVGNGQVGAGSVRGMPLLARLRAEGFAIWPFDAAGERTAFEIYPSAMPAAGRGRGNPRFATQHDRDAFVSALAMWEHRDELASLPAATDPTVLIEGDLWTPPS